MVSAVDPRSHLALGGHGDLWFGTSVADAYNMMMRMGIRRLPVVDEEGRPAGVITETDMFRMLIDRWDLYMAQRAEPVLMYSPIGAVAHP
jgi:CBS domain-containing protein